MKKFKLGFVILVTTVLVSVGISYSCKENKTYNAEILWDTFGVPHIFAKNNSSAFYAFGYAQMHSHGNQLLKLFAQQRGKLTEYFGENYEQKDVLTHQLGIPVLAENWYADQTPEFKTLLTAFVTGLNDYAQKNSSELFPEAKDILPIKEKDILGLSIQTMSHFLLANTSQCSKILFGQTAQKQKKQGSNAWLISPQFTSTKNTMLLANPHLSWFYDNSLDSSAAEQVFYEAHIKTPDIDNYGVTLMGFPILAIAFNKNLAWTHTVNTIKGCDVFQLKKDASDENYVVDNEIKKFDTKTVTLKIKSTNGQFIQKNISIKNSIYGPTFQINDQFYAVQYAAFQLFPRKYFLTQWWEMNLAKNLTEFSSSLKQMELPMFNVFYADKNENILFFDAGIVPKKEAYSTDSDTIFPGDTTKTIWQNFYSYTERPKLLNPENGWIQNANSDPWFTAFTENKNVIQKSNYAIGITVGEQTMSLRDQRSAKLLSQKKIASLSDLIDRKYNPEVELASRVLSDLIELAAKSKDSDVIKAGEILTQWDKTTNENSIGANLFLKWFDIYSSRNESLLNAKIFKNIWDPKLPLTTPNGIASPIEAIAALKEATKQIINTTGKIDVPWGNLNRMLIKNTNYNFPANGGPGDPYGIFRVLTPCPDTKSSHNVTCHGDSYIAAVEFSEPMKAKVLLTYGNSSQPNSKHRGDQLPLTSKKQLRDALLTREEIEMSMEGYDILDHK
ncbi:penicillin acylase family protein [Pigmentibacter sp. JX0631]|uniref:penicillin acylase family protein n=1 Tax=Pigmentibacter sp. JX0631 TaxID=2976982 RepID=UPI00246852F5|nr:penicillin acylase family protein [Pigmentibacter sp. JX0631]WGL60765.1 penicillin acylase family protein [Pigmentibacter sp. JX0631]